MTLEMVVEKFRHLVQLVSRDMSAVQKTLNEQDGHIKALAQKVQQLEAAVSASAMQPTQVFDNYDTNTEEGRKAKLRMQFLDDEAP